MKYFSNKNQSQNNESSLDSLGLSGLNEFDASDIENLFTALSKELEHNSESSARYALYLTGGGAMLLSIGARRTTTDVDVIFKENDSFIRDCAVRVSESLGIHRKWCNDAVAKSSSYTPAILLNSTLYKSYGCLDIYTVNPDLLLCMKLISFREKDKSDIHDLVNYIEHLDGKITIDLLNELYKEYYEDYGIKPKFARGAVSYITRRFS